MSERMDSLLDSARLSECARNDAAMAANEPVRQPFIVQIKEGPKVIHEFGSMGTDGLSLAVEMQKHCEAGQYVKCIPARWGFDPFPVVAAEQALECAKLREITEAELIAADVARATNKGPRLAALNDDAARDLQVQLSGFIGGLPQ